MLASLASLHQLGGQLAQASLYLRQTSKWGLNESIGLIPPPGQIFFLAPNLSLSQHSEFIDDTHGIDKNPKQASPKIRVKTTRPPTIWKR
jgi:hypothetical protein